MTKQTRREFLENSMFAAAAAAVTGSAASRQVFAAEGSKSPNERLRVAVLGVNGRGQSHLSAFMKRNDTEVVAIVDPDESVGQRKGVERVLKSTNKKPVYYQDLRKAMDDTSIDIITVATPNHWHSLAAIWAIQAGKDVYLEKPVSHNVSEGRRVVEAARKYNKICQTGTQTRSNPGMQEAIEFVRSGKIGKISVARGLCYKRRKSIGPRGNYDVPASVDYNVWLGPASEKQLTRRRFHYDWHWQWDYGNGDLGNQGIHQMDISRWGLGVDDLGHGVVSYGGRLSYTDAGETANTQVSIFDYGDRKLVFEVRGLETDSLRGAKVGVIFHGSDGYVVINNYSGGAAFDLDGNEVKKFDGRGDDYHYANFIDAVRSRKKEDLNADILEGHLSSALCHLGNVSYRLGSQVSIQEAERLIGGNADDIETLERTAEHLSRNGVDLESAKIGFGAKLTLDGKKEVFTGELASKANPMLTREYRKGFEVPAAGRV
ncbi:MAG: Gfo/Idh/MocA family oxidoreductase [Planctomycetes bacterium]|nr:Gfo/Idh/MocA family oxidoreductase [Planctomycetota bacterium]